MKFYWSLSTYHCALINQAWKAVLGDWNFDKPEQIIMIRLNFNPTLLSHGRPTSWGQLDGLWCLYQEAKRATKTTTTTAALAAATTTIKIEKRDIQCIPGRLKQHARWRWVSSLYVNVPSFWIFEMPHLPETTACQTLSTPTPRGVTRPVHRKEPGTQWVKQTDKKTKKQTWKLNTTELRNHEAQKSQAHAGIWSYLRTGGETQNQYVSPQDGGRVTLICFLYGDVRPIGRVIFRILCPLCPCFPKRKEGNTGPDITYAGIAQR